MGTKIVVMKDGLIQQIGSPMEIYNSPVNLFVAGFIGSPMMNFIPCQILSDADRLVIDAESFQLPIPAWKTHHFGSASGSAVILGIRPNDIYDARSAPQRMQGEVIPAVIDVIEPLGPEIQLTVNIGRHNLKACIGVDHTLKVNQKIELAFDLDRVHLFGEEPPHLRYDIQPEHSAGNQLPSGSIQGRG
jgi:multiple sugar transport system ATP-binding protein